MHQFTSVNPSSRHDSQAQIGATLKNWILAMLLKPFVADRWILVSSPSPDGELVVAASKSTGPVAAASLPVWAWAVRGRPATAEDGDDGSGCGAASGPDNARVDGSRRC
jgi:hypothetical protein